jgi:hypothetical protein
VHQLLLLDVYNLMEFQVVLPKHLMLKKQLIMDLYYHQFHAKFKDGQKIKRELFLLLLIPLMVMVVEQKTVLEM